MAAGSMSYICSKIYPECAYVVTTQLDATNLPLILTHLELNHNTARPVYKDATYSTAFTYSV